MKLTTERLFLRPFRDDDRQSNADIFGDPDVRRYSLGVLDDRSANSRLNRFVTELQQMGYGMLAVEDRRDGRFIGTLGLTGFGDALKASIPSQPSLQIAWQLAKHAWGKGLATEGAQAVLSYAFRNLHPPEIVAITAQINAPSRRVMDKIGMLYDPSDDFSHPDIPMGHPLAPHVLYRITSDEFIA